VAIAGGTNGGFPVFSEYYRAGVDTIFTMHVGEADLMRLRAEPVAEDRAIVVSGHISSDSIGILMFLTYLVPPALLVLPLHGQPLNHACGQSRAGAQERRELGDAVAPGALPSAVAIASDGIHTAVIQHLDGLDGGVADQLTISGPEGARQPLGQEALGERLLDLSWSPQTDGLILLSERQMSGGRQFRIRWIGTDSSSRDLADLPGLVASSNVFVAPHMGYTLIEAGLTGVPIVTYDYDFHNEIISDGATGYRGRARQPVTSTAG